MRINDGVSDRMTAYLFFDTREVAGMIGHDGAKKREMLAFADANYETFIWIVASLNKALTRDEVPFAGADETDVCSTWGSRGRARIYRYSDAFSVE